VLPLGVGNWSLTSLQQRLVKTGGWLIKRVLYCWLLLAEGQFDAAALRGHGAADGGVARADRIGRRGTEANQVKGGGGPERCISNRLEIRHFRVFPYSKEPELALPGQPESLGWKNLDQQLQLWRLNL